MGPGERGEERGEEGWEWWRLEGSWALRPTDPGKTANCKPTPCYVMGRSGRDGSHAEIGAVLIIF